MRKKVFALDQVLNFRKEVEKVCKVEFASAKREFDVAHGLLRREEEAVDRLGMEFMDKQLAGICAMELQLYSDFFSKKSVDIKAQRRAVICLDDQVSEKRDILLEAAIDKKVLEELREKKIRAHNQHLAEKDRAFLDELALRKGDQAKR